MRNTIFVQGARENNLKNVDVEIPRDALCVFTGLSGSGKSSLAFNTIYAEGRRRYVESLSAFVRQFLGQMDKPDVDVIEGLSPAISIDQKTTSKNPRSTVGTVTEIYDYLRLLWARVGIPHCPKCGREIRRQTIDQIVDRVLLMPEGTRFEVLAPIVRGKKGEHAKLLADARRGGFSRVRVDGMMYDLSEEIPMEKNNKHRIELVVDRLIVRGDITRRLTDSVETALSHADGLVLIHRVDTDEETLFSRNYACEDCGISMPELSPRMFSFNNPMGACPACAGLGYLLKVDPALVLPDTDLSIYDGAIQASGWGNIKNDSIARMYFEAMAKKYRFDLHRPIKDLSAEVLDVILYGTRGEQLELHYNRGNGSGTLRQAFEGIIPNIERRSRETQSEAVRKELEEYMSTSPCPHCHGDRLSDITRAVTVGGMSISAFCALSVDKGLEFINALKLEGSFAVIAEQILHEIRSRLGFLRSVGLRYLTLSRSAGTLSGGESQRIRLATQIGSSLMGVLYILDEPSIGLHQSDNEKLLATLRDLRDLGNTLIVVEHDEDTIRAADYIVDVGPYAGIRGGEIVAQGTLQDIIACPESITGQYLSGKRRILPPAVRRAGSGKTLSVYGASANNLRSIDVHIPLGTLTCITGVSGSGKSSLVNEIICNKLANKLNHARTRAGKHERFEGIDALDKIINIDQSPIGRTPRSNPATYTGLFSDIRDLFASTADAKARGYSAGRFSFNVKGGRCEACCGDGLVKIEMHFLPDVYVACDVCHGKRYNRETLEVLYKGKNISDVLEMTADEALEFFDNLPRIRAKVATLVEVGLGYIKLGQSSTTLSGGEAQRVKLATELSRRATGRTIYVLDEPTTGLHMYDTQKLLGVLQTLVDAGNSVLIIEHNLDMIKSADHIIDLGPDGGDGGGRIVACGTPEEVAQAEGSYTGQYLKNVL
ncbi:MAG: excinuclease ABC subunit UvrA [Oscillospiraceae bacterium]|jgi:excinuclease ABC subunit A|nr:excinuclease ABC subunit UvrA [Oscillospiraceae bacterium]